MKIAVNGGIARFEHNGRMFSVTFHRTVRLPEDGKTHALPPSLGLFPVKLVDDYKDKVPAAWRGHGGVFIPLHQREALWLGFAGFPAAVKVAAGKVNAVNGKPWVQELVAGVEDYMVAPHPQPWLDGFNAGSGVIKQFVAMPMGMGYTVEGQVTGKEDHGGLQLLVVPAKPGSIPEQVRHTSMTSSFMSMSASDDSMVDSMVYNSMAGEQKTGGGMLRSRGIGGSSAIGSSMAKSAEMGLAAGGTMTQKIYPDPHGVEVWDQASAGRLFVHIVNAEMYEEITGEKCPSMPVTAQEYSGMYFGLNDGMAHDIAAPEVLQNVLTVGQKDKQHGFEGQQDDSTVNSGNTLTYSHTLDKDTVRDGTW